MAKLKITQKRSVIGRPGRQKATMEALGLRKINASVEVEATPQVHELHILGQFAQGNMQDATSSRYQAILEFVYKF